MEWCHGSRARSRAACISFLPAERLLGTLPGLLSFSIELHRGGARSDAELGPRERTYLRPRAVPPDRFRGLDELGPDNQLGDRMVAGPTTEQTRSD